jgi:hypothetical protein
MAFSCFPVASMFEVFADRRAPTSLGTSTGKTCCRIVTVQTIRNGLVSADAKLSSFVAAVYALQEAGHFRRSVGLPLRPIVAENLWTQG